MQHVAWCSFLQEHIPETWAANSTPEDHYPHNYVVDLFVESEVVGGERKEEAGPRGLSLVSVLVEERVTDCRVFLEAK